ncbi:MAG: zinc ribbon domain-containing protein [Armatimonadetes bacterium]|nr:zinc ribbon domain-containing protein [Armatimonadota bacterium]
MECGKCGTEIPPGSRFCPGCGAPASREVFQTTGAQPAATDKKKVALVAAAVGLCVAAVIAAFLLRGPRVTDQGPTSAPIQPPVLNTETAPPARQPGVLQSPTTEAKQPEKKEVPEEVVKYLEHLKKVEQYRQTVYSKELQSVMADASDAIMKALPFDWDEDGAKSPTDNLAKKSMDFTREWQQVSAYFLQMPAPPDCGPLGQKYYESLSTFIVFMGKFQAAVSKNDIAGLNSVKADAGTLDKKFTAADAELAKVCDKFGLEKTFSIRGDAGQTPVFGF